ncbi:LysR family transcriptional regulator [Endozoicomonas sp. Mp262]|uniref:LysR family transcriptional regulator n=1 Tax=Endozoicomonas sp. Mp262 TaxID=2919499 RepID=UPI0021D867DB
MHITLRQLRAFRAVASLGQVQLAAHQLSLSQPATSMAISELEKQLNCRLFDRTSNRLVLNPQGIRLLPLACELLDRSNEIGTLFQQRNQTPSGKLTIGASTTIGNYLIPQVLASHEKNHPGITATLDIQNTSTLINKLAAFDIDIACIEGPCQHSDMEVIPWLEDELVVFCSPSHPLAGMGNQPISLQDLEDESWILRESGSGTRMLFDFYIAQHLRHLNIRMELNQTEAIKQLVLAGTGISCLSRYCIARELEQKELVSLALKGCALTRKLSILIHKKKYIGPLLDSLLQQLWQAARS